MQQNTALIRKVRAALTHHAHLDLQRNPLEISAHEGVVRLQGMLNTLRQKRRVEQSARAVSGVRELYSNLRIRPVVTKRDEELVLAVRNALLADRSIDDTAIAITARDGVVTLRGLVSTCMQRRLVVATIWWLLGVQDVRDELQVLYEEEDGDDELQEACHILLDKDPLVDETEVSVLAEDGVVTLAGAVGSEIAREAAENTIWAIEGVKDVRNHLLVVPGEMPAGQREMGI